MSTSKPNLTRVWAAGAAPGNVVDPDTSAPGKFDDGWLAEVPTFQHFNFLQQLFTQGLAHNNEEGINSWDTDTTYPINGLAKGSNGTVFVAVIEQNGNDPVSDDGTNWKVWFSPELLSNVVDTFAAALAYDGNTTGAQLLITKGYSNPGIGSAEYIRTGSTGSPGTGDVDDFFDAGGVEWTRKDKLTRFGSFSVVVDTTDEFVRDTVLPEITSRGYVAALAVPLSSLESSYTRMNLTDIHDYIRTNNGEVLSHAINGIPLDASVETTYGESSIRTSKFELVKYGFRTNAFVAINSILDSKFIPEVKKWYDYAYIRSTDGSNDANSVNGPESDVYNLTRVSLESGTLQDMKDVGDYAKNTFQNVVYYTHASLTNLEDTLDYVASIGLKFELCSEWMARIHGLKKPMLPQPTENIISNSDFLKFDSTDLSPARWTIQSGTMTSISAPITPTESGGIIDINAVAAAADERLLFTQIYNSGDVGLYTAFCFAINALSLDATNTQIRLTLSAKDAGSSTITQSVKDFTIRGGKQRLFTELGVIPGGTTVSFIQITIELISIAAGSVRAILDSPFMGRSWTPERYDRTSVKETMFTKMRKNIQGSTLLPNTDTDIIFDNVLTGTNEIYDTGTGEFTTEDNRKYDVKVHLGLKSMVAGDLVTIKLFRNGIQNETATFVCAAGQMTFPVGFTISGNGDIFKIVMRHNGSNGRLTTTGYDAMLSLTSMAK